MKVSDTARSRSENKEVSDHVLATHIWNNVFPEHLIEVSEPWSVSGRILAVL